jgi:hypothetical protein
MSASRNRPRLGARHRVTHPVPDCVRGGPQRGSGLSDISICGSRIDMRERIRIWFRGFGVLVPRTYLASGVEVETRLAVERDIALEAPLVTAPVEHGQRHRDRDVDTDLTRVRQGLKLPRRGSRVGLRRQRCARTKEYASVGDVQRWKLHSRCEGVSTVHTAIMGREWSVAVERASHALSVRVDDLDGVVERIGGHDGQNRAEDLVPAR